MSGSFPVLSMRTRATSRVELRKLEEEGLFRLLYKRTDEVLFP